MCQLQQVLNFLLTQYFPFPHSLIIHPFFFYQRKNEILQRNTKPDDKQLEKSRSIKLMSEGKEGTSMLSLD